MIQQVHSHPDIYRIRVDLPDNPLLSALRAIVRVSGLSVCIYFLQCRFIWNCDHGSVQCVQYGHEF